MPSSGQHNGGLTQRARYGEPQPAPIHTNVGEPSTRKDLKSWWKNFSRSAQQKREEEKAAAAAQTPMGIFGIPLQTSVRYANVAISLQDADGNSYVYGYVPIVVAKCGVFLKEKATDVEGIFRLSGSEKRIKELKEAFNSPDRYGKGLDWTGYTVHDAANILRRYFNQLPEPIIPLDFYDRFRDPLRNHQSQAVGQIEGQSPAIGDFDHASTIRVYQHIITELPPLNRQLLLYILDLLAVFASKSDLNKMTTPNLAAIFQPGILSHPSHDMAPPEYRLSQDVLIFLIENQDHFLIGMAGTGADEKTKQDVESGPPTPSANKAPKSLLGRSSSGASKYSGVRRSVSVSSKQSQNPVPSPVATTPLTPTATGVHRSNTVPSKHSPRPSHARFHRDPPSETSSPAVTPMYTPAEVPGAFPNIGESNETSAVGPAAARDSIPAPPEVTSPSPEATPAIGSAEREPLAQQPVAGTAETVEERQPRPEAIEIPQSSRTLSPPPPGQETPTSGSSRLAVLFGGKPASPSGDGGTRKPNKLQKKRVPGSSNPSAQSSQHSLSDIAAPNAEQMSTGHSSMASSAPLLAQQQQPAQLPAVAQQAPATTPTTSTFLQPPHSNENTPLKPPPVVGQTQPMSPANSYRSHSEFTEGELDDVQPLDHAGPAEITSDKETDAPEAGKRRRFWRRKGDSVSYVNRDSQSPAPNVEAQRSRSSVLSGGGHDKEAARKSLTLDRNTTGTATLSDPESGDREERDRERNKGLNWIKGKIAERAERKEAEKRAKSPPPAGVSGVGSDADSNYPRGSVQSLGAAAAAANFARTNSTPGSGFDTRRDDNVTPTPSTMYQQPHAASVSAAASGLRSPPMADVPQRGKSMDIRRPDPSHAAEVAMSPPKQSMDASSPSLAQKPTLAAIPSAAQIASVAAFGQQSGRAAAAPPPVRMTSQEAVVAAVGAVGGSSTGNAAGVGRRRSLLEIGEEAIAARRAAGEEAKLVGPEGGNVGLGLGNGNGNTTGGGGNAGDVAAPAAPYKI